VDTAHVSPFAVVTYRHTSKSHPATENNTAVAAIGHTIVNTQL
jgi:hypothetical protein